MRDIAVALVAVAAVLFLLPLIGVVLGAFCGWMVGLFFGPTIHAFLTALSPSLGALETWQVGAGLGFVGSFFKSSVTTNSKD